MHSKIDFASLRERTAAIDPERAADLRAQVQRRHAKYESRVRTALFGGGALAALASIVVVTMLLRRPEAPVAANAGFGGLVLADGSHVTFLAAGSELAQSGSQGRQTTLVRGAARFDVVHDSSAPFRVVAGAVIVEDVGTVFTVRLAPDGSAFVGVESGAVTVRGSHGEAVLGAGASQSFVASVANNEAPTASAHAVFAPVASAPTPAEPSASVAAHPAPPASWKKLAQSGEYAKAYVSMEEHRATLRDDPDELLLAADAARFSGHPASAVPLLRRLVEKFPSDSRAGLAAFTLGRVLLDDLGNPNEAAVAFAMASKRGGPLAEDALAREVEAWNRAGDRKSAKDTATRYLAAFPEGRRAAFVRQVAESP